MRIVGSRPPPPPSVANLTLFAWLDGCREPQSIVREKTKEGKKEAFGLVHKEGGRKKGERQKV